MADPKQEDHSASQSTPGPSWDASAAGEWIHQPVAASTITTVLVAAIVVCFGARILWLSTERAITAFHNAVLPVAELISLVLTPAVAVFALVTTYSVEKPGGGKELTRYGRIGIGLIALTGALNIWTARAGEYMDDLRAAESAVVESARADQLADLLSRVTEIADVVTEVSLRSIALIELETPSLAARGVNVTLSFGSPADVTLEGAYVASGIPPIVPSASPDPLTNAIVQVFRSRSFIQTRTAPLSMSFPLGRTRNAPLTLRDLDAAPLRVAFTENRGVGEAPGPPLVGNSEVGHSVAVLNLMFDGGRTRMVFLRWDSSTGYWEHERVPSADDM